MQFTKFYPRLTLLALIIILFLLITRKQDLEYFLGNLSGAIDTIKQNFQTQLNPPRAFVGNRLKKEDEFKMYLGEPFRSFNVQDWENFWKIIYGVYAKENPQGIKLLPVYRQLSQDEMQEELVNKYPAPFAYFNQAQWEAFWNMVFSK